MTNSYEPPASAGTTKPATRAPNTMGAAAATLTAMALVLGLVGCAVGPDYEPPSITLEPFHNAPSVEARAAPAAPKLDHWWSGFNDPLLDRLIEQALQQNLDLTASIARIQQARAVAQAAGAQLLPTVDLSNQATTMRQSVNSPLGEIANHLPGYSRDKRIYDVGGEASWEIDLAGGLRRGVEASGAEAEAAEFELAGTRIMVAADIADAYFQIRGNQARIAFVEGQINVDTRLVDLVRQRRSNQISSEREMAQAEAVLEQARAKLPQLRIALESQLNRLDVLLGSQPGANGALMAASKEIPTIPAIPEANDTTDFLRRRPDIIAAERQLQASNARIGVALADYYPKFSLSGLLGFESVSANHLFTQASFQPAGTAGLRWRLFDFGKVDAEVSQARGAHAEALAHFRATVLQASQDVEDAFMGLVQTEERTRRLEAEVNALARSRDLSQQAYMAGVIALTDVLDADRLLLTAQDDLALNRADAARAAVKSFRALGGGWSS